MASNRKKDDDPQPGPTTPVGPQNGLTDQSWPGMVHIVIVPVPTPDNPNNVAIRWHIANYDPHLVPYLCQLVARAAAEQHKGMPHEKGKEHEISLDQSEEDTADAAV